jgi:DNA-binding NarL/FixJ family response regulator
MRWLCSGTSRNLRVLLFSARTRIIQMPSRMKKSRPVSGVIPYALRHSSIVRGLRKGLPIQQVAKLHNTSVKMIERHYAKYIATALEDLARAAVVSLVRRSDGNVIPMGKRA